jgi:hypothetical protein
MKSKNPYPSQQDQKQMDCPLKIDNRYGLIFPSSTKPISGTVQSGELGSCEILISDRNSNEILRKPVTPDQFGTLTETPFTWDLKSKSNFYVKSGCYTISLIDKSKEICSIECKVADTRNILPITESLKRSRFAPDIQALILIYFDIIKDIQIAILERLENNRFEEPYFIACITAGFIEEIVDDMQNQSKSRFLDLISEFQSKHPTLEKATGLGLRGLFDFLIKYMANAEDHVRANAMARCGQRYLTQNDKVQIVSSLVAAIYPHCLAGFPKNAVGDIGEKIIGGIIRLGIRYVSVKHVGRSISLCRTLPLGNPCDSVPGNYRGQ